MELWFNPACSKCAIAKETLDEAGVDYTVRRYLDEPPSPAQLREALAALRLEPWDITRLDEPLAVELGLPDAARDPEAWVEVLCAHPALIQRPILLAADGTAWVGRDPDAVAAAVAAESSAQSSAQSAAHARP